MTLTIGNHDFDNGVEGLYAQMPHAKFEFLSANYDLKHHDGRLSKPIKFSKKRHQGWCLWNWN
jgi:5'-nucleotidase